MVVPLSIQAQVSADSLSHIHADVWPAHAWAGVPESVLPTGCGALDAELPAGGWPLGSLIEILQPSGVHSEWQLLLPALARSGEGLVVLISPPHVPFAPALAARGLAPQRVLQVLVHQASQRLWASEQALRCTDVAVVLAWLPQVRSTELRRLQLAASEHRKLLFVMRLQQAQAEASAAPLRLSVEPAQDASLRVKLLKRRGPPPSGALNLLVRPAGFSVVLAAGAMHALDCAF